MEVRVVQRESGLFQVETREKVLFMLRCGTREEAITHLHRKAEEADISLRVVEIFSEERIQWSELMKPSVVKGLS